jgi:hypothetical protein
LADNIGEENEKLGNSLVRLAIECIWIWSKWFPIDFVQNKLSLFKIADAKLKFSGVKMAKLIFFQNIKELVTIHIPEAGVLLIILFYLRPQLR